MQNIGYSLEFDALMLNLKNPEVDKKCTQSA